MRIPHKWNYSSKTVAWWQQEHWLRMEKGSAKEFSQACFWMCLLQVWQALKANDKSCRTVSLEGGTLQASSTWTLKYLKVVQPFKNLSAKARTLTSMEDNSYSQIIRSGLRQGNFWWLLVLFVCFVLNMYWLLVFFHAFRTSRCILWIICQHPFKSATQSPHSLMYAFCWCSVLPAN